MVIGPHAATAKAAIATTARFAHARSIESRFDGNEEFTPPRSDHIEAVGGASVHRRRYRCESLLPFTVSEASEPSHQRNARSPTSSSVDNEPGADDDGALPVMRCVMKTWLSGTI